MEENVAKNDLLGGSLWDQYSEKVNNRMANPKYRGSLSEDDAIKRGGRLVVADWGAESCGDTVRLYWIVEDKSELILDSRFKSFGCGTAIASSDIMAELCIGKTVDEAVKITNIDVEMALRDDPDTPAVPPQKMHCSVMAYDVIKKAVSIYKNVDMESLEEEEIVCECARVSLATIKEVIRLNDLKTVEEITNYTKAGAFCKSCIKPGGHEKKKYYLVDILRDTRAEMMQEDSMDRVQTFEEMTLVQKIKAVESCLDKHVRAHLAKDGGGVDVVDIKEIEGGINLFIHYLGACRSCAGSVGTVIFIEQQLQKYLDKTISVYTL